MKVLPIGLIFLILLSAILSVYAQNATSAKAILDKVSQNYSNYKTIKADFSLKGENLSDKSTYGDKGRVYLVPGSGKYKIEMENHALISDGKTQWSVLIELGEVQISDVNPNDISINPSNIFSFYNKGYKMNLTGEAKLGSSSLYVIELTPEDKNQNISNIQMRINKGDHLIYDATVSDKNGNKHTYTLSNTEVNRSFSPGIFSFYKHNYPGIEIIDLR